MHIWNSQTVVPAYGLCSHVPKDVLVITKSLESRWRLFTLHLLRVFRRLSAGRLAPPTCQSDGIRGNDHPAYHEQIGVESGEAGGQLPDWPPAGPVSRVSRPYHVARPEGPSPHLTILHTLFPHSCSLSSSKTRPRPRRTNTLT